MNKKISEFKSKKIFFICAIILVIVATAIFAPFIANNRPIVCKIENQICFPVFQQLQTQVFSNKIIDNADWINKNYTWSIFPPVRYLPEEQYILSRFLPPFTADNRQNRKIHYFGTDALGRDIAACVIYGARVSLSLGILATGLAFLIGIIAGILSGFFSDNFFKVSLRNALLASVLGVLLLHYFIQYLNNDFIQINGIHNFFTFGVILIVVILIFYVLKIIGKKINLGNRTIAVPFDFLVLRIIEMINAMPKVIVVIAVMTIVKPSFYTLALLIGLFSWTSIARLLRAEILQVKALPYIDAARVSGYSTWQIVFQHILPNAIQPVIVYLSYIIAQSILAESTFSFLGIGLSNEDAITWGYLLRIARENTNAWWIGLAPGLALFVTVYILNSLSDIWRDYFNKKNI